MEAKQVEVKPQTLSDAYPPNESYQLFRLIVGTGAKCSSSLHVSVNEPKASILVRALAISTEGSVAVDHCCSSRPRG